MTLTSSTLPDEILVKRSRKQPEVFADLYHRYVQRIYAYHLMRTGNVADAEDLTSQTFMAALEGIGTFRGQGNFAAWLFSIARRKTIDLFRQNNRQISTELDENVESVDPPPEENADRQVSLTQIWKGMQLVKPEKAEVLRLRFFAGLSYSEIGQLTDKSESAAKMFVIRALKELRAHLPPDSLEVL